jgi:ribonuclease HII
MQYFIGIDEAGRGALAGPVCVGAVLYPNDFNWQEAFALITKRGEPKLRDSKKMSATQREIVYEYIVANASLKYAHAFTEASVIDTIGIVPATLRAVANSIQALGVQPAQARVVLDAGLRAPSGWQQESFVRGDENIPAISFASIIAKVSRDRHMENLGSNYAAYGFDQHKGYGTSAHYAALKQHGISGIHRKSFLDLTHK